MSADTRRAIRSTVQFLVILAALLPLIVDAAEIPRTLPWVGGALAVAAAITRVMALPQVERRLPSWLKKEAPKKEARE